MRHSRKHSRSTCHLHPSTKFARRFLAHFSCKVTWSFARMEKQKRFIVELNFSERSPSRTTSL